jgi:tetratricopeptide (TPR) repeat protein
MKSVSKFALIFALGAFSVVPLASVQAQKDEKAAKKDKNEKKGKDKPAPAFQPKLSKEFAAAYNPAVTPYVKSKDPAPAVAAWPSVKAAIKTEDDRYQAGVFGFDIGRAAKNDAMQQEGIDLVIASTSTPADQRNAYTYMKGAFAYDAKNWTVAEASLIKAQTAGYKANSIPGGVEMLIADALGQQKKYPEALDWVQKSIDGSKIAGAAALPANTYTKAANLAIKSKNNTLISKWMKALVRANPSTDFWHDALIQSYNSLNYDPQETLDLMRLLRKVGAMKYEQNYGIYVDAADKRRLPAEVVAVLNDGFKAGTISKTNLRYSEDFKDAETRLATDRAQLPVVERDAQNAKTGYDAILSGDILLSYAEYTKAAAIYEAALAKGGLADRDGKDQTDRALTRLGIAKLFLGDAAGARAAFGKVTSSNRREIADYWLLHMDLAAAPAAPAPKPAG